MKKKNNSSIIITIVIMVIALLLGIYGLILNFNKKELDAPSSSMPSVSEIINTVAFSFEEFNVFENCDFTTTNICEKEIGTLTNNEVSTNIKIKYEKLENNYFNLIIYSDANELIKLENEIGELYLIKIINKEHLNLNIKNNSEDILKFYNKEGYMLQNGSIATKGSIFYNEENITFNSLNCDSEYKDNLFKGTLTITNNVVNITYEKTDEVNDSGTKCE